MATVTIARGATVWDATCDLDAGAQIRHGRADPAKQPAAPTLTGQILDGTPLARLVELGDRVTVTDAAGPTRFVGYVTDVDTNTEAAQRFVATGWIARLGQLAAAPVGARSLGPAPRPCYATWSPPPGCPAGSCTGADATVDPVRADPQESIRVRSAVSVRIRRPAR